MGKVVKAGGGVFGKSGIAALIQYSKFSHIRLVRGTLVADVVTHQAETLPEMQFKPSVFADEFTAREVSARPFPFFSKLESEALGERYCTENLGTVEQCLLRTKHWNRHLGLSLLYSIAEPQARARIHGLGQLAQNCTLPEHYRAGPSLISASGSYRE